MDSFPPGFASYRKAFPELVIPPDEGDPNSNPEGEDENSDTTAEASAGSIDVDKPGMRPGSISADSADSTTDSLIFSPTDASGTPSSEGGISRRHKQNLTAPVMYKTVTADQRASFCSPAIQTKKNMVHNISPALSENSTPSHCNCKKSKCLKLYVTYFYAFVCYIPNKFYFYADIVNVLRHLDIAIIASVLIVITVPRLNRWAIGSID